MGRKDCIKGGMTMRGGGLIADVAQTLAAYRARMSVYYLGSTLLVVVVLLTHFSNGSMALVGGVTYADFMCLAGIVCAAAVLVGRRPLRHRRVVRRLLVALTLVAAATFLLSSLAPLSVRLWFLTVSAVAGGAFVAAASIFWFDYFADVPLEETLISLAICLIGGCAISWFLLGVLPSRLIVGVLTLILAAGGVLAGALGRDAESRRDDDRQKLEVQSPIMLLITVAMLCFACMFSLSLGGRMLWHSEDVWLFVAPAALMVLVVVLFFKRIEIGALLHLALILALVSVLLSSFFPLDASVLLVVATNGFVITISLAIVFMLKLAKNTARAPHELGALLLIAVFAGSIAGRGIAEIVLVHADDSARAAVAAGAVVLLVISVVASLNSKSLMNIARRTLAKARSEEDEQVAYRRRVQQLASDSGLGSRESEVLFLLLEGCTAREVAEKMFVADGTAKAHIRHVYQKLDVHDRESLFGVVRQAVEQREA